MTRRLLISFLSLLTCAQTALAAPAVTPSDRVKRNVIVRPQPGSNQKVGALNPGEKAELLDQLPSWYHIGLGDGRTGYVRKTWTVVTDTGTVAVGAGAQPIKVHIIDVGTGL